MTSTFQQPNTPILANTVTSTTSARTQPPAFHPGTNQPNAPAPAGGRSSYASATKKSFSPNVSEPTTMPAVVGGPVAAHHGHNDSISPATGKNNTIPAIPTVGGPTIVNGNNALTPSASSDHSRKPSFIITPSGATGFSSNSGPGTGQNKANGIQFGSLAASGSPAPGSAPVLANQSSSNLGVGSMPPRVPSPQTSPSPIPQPAISGGRPPSSLQGQNVVFGQPEANDPNVGFQDVLEVLRRTDPYL